MAVFAHDPVQQRSFDRLLDRPIPPSTPDKRLDNNGLRGAPHDKSTPITPPEKKHYRLFVVLAFHPMVEAHYCSVIVSICPVFDYQMFFDPEGKTLDDFRAQRCAHGHESHVLPSRVAMVFAGRHREARPRQTRTGWIMAAKLAQTVVR
jgi:hypothetical protein